MATKEQKVERRWRIVKSILLFNALWAIAVFSAFLYAYDVTKLDIISGALFGSSVMGLIGNWMSTPTGDSEEAENDS
jgi:hypothetical protein